MVVMAGSLRFKPRTSNSPAFVSPTLEMAFEQRTLSAASPVESIQEPGKLCEGASVEQDSDRVSHAAGIETLPEPEPLHLAANSEGRASTSFLAQ